MLGQKLWKRFRWFFGKFKTPQFSSEISWPLGCTLGDFNDIYSRATWNSNLEWTLFHKSWTATGLLNLSCQYQNAKWQCLTITPEISDSNRMSCEQSFFQILPILLCKSNFQATYCDLNSTWFSIVSTFSKQKKTQILVEGFSRSKGGHWVTISEFMYVWN